MSPARYPEAPSPAYRSRSPSPPMPEPHLHVDQPAPAQPTESPTSDESQPLPNPNVSVEDEGPNRLDERSLNALAAREISKQMEMSSSPLSPPFPLFAGRKSVSPRPSFTSETPSSDSSIRFGQIPPPPQLSQLTSSRVIRDSTPSPNPPQTQLQLPPPPPALPHTKSAESTNFTQPDDAYRTPPEYLRDSSIPPSPSITPASSPPIPQVTSALSPSPTTPTTTKKISAAAFKRAGMKGVSSNTNLRDDTLRSDSLSVGFLPNPSRERGDGENGDESPDTAVTPLNLRKKSLPAVPGISTNLLSGPRGPGAPRSISSPFPNLKANEEQPLGPGGTFPSSSLTESQPRESMLVGDDFDYVSAYLNEDESRESGIHDGVTNGHGQGGGGPPQNVGYGSGKFSTRLD